MAQITTATKQPDIHGRGGVLNILVFLSRRGASIEVIQLAMVRAGISVEVARLLAQCVVSTRAAPPAAVAPRTLDRSGRVAEIALQKLIGLVILVAIIWGVGITLGFAIGMEMGFTQGLENGLDRVRQLVGL